LHFTGRCAKIETVLWYKWHIRIIQPQNIVKSVRIYTASDRGGALYRPLFIRLFVFPTGRRNKGDQHDAG